MPEPLDERRQSTRSVRSAHSSPVESLTTHSASFDHAIVRICSSWKYSVNRDKTDSAANLLRVAHVNGSGHRQVHSIDAP
ncbi:hypothetical protein I7I50_08063 [Histoplasma capsulatum G186AR]|uniref:Uncharacterized protein n=1 Tax=Ajellomyces capsulatus TaxID=5037 RepID=A0A8H7YK56_AJECA|nr:hypothetical protein I7I52_08579 [Histoplasma capsulatum]QSS68600.1 hypothetical protein I7I50_08063 [Histoplasma capsulatum G186AR]